MADGAVAAIGAAAAVGPAITVADTGPAITAVDITTTKQSRNYDHKRATSNGAARFSFVLRAPERNLNCAFNSGSKPKWKSGGSVVKL